MAAVVLGFGTPGEGGVTPTGVDVGCTSPPGSAGMFQLDSSPVKLPEPHALASAAAAVNPKTPQHLTRRVETLPGDAAPETISACRRRKSFNLMPEQYQQLSLSV